MYLFQLFYEKIVTLKNISYIHIQNTIILCRKKIQVRRDSAF